MGPSFDTSFLAFRAKAAQGEGGRKSTCSESVGKQVFFTVFRMRLFLSDQGARSRGPGGFWPDLTKSVQRVLEDPLDPARTLVIWHFAGTFPSRDSSFHTHKVAPLSHLGLGDQAGRAGSGPWRPKDCDKEPEPAPGRKGAGSCCF